MKNIILITIDALRADNLSCYGYKYKTSKNIDVLAKKSILFENAYSCINATDPSFTSLFTGIEPHNHGIINHSKDISKEEFEKFNNQDNEWLTTILKNAGYKCIGFDWLGR